MINSVIALQQISLGQIWVMTHDWYRCKWNKDMLNYTCDYYQFLLRYWLEQPTLFCFHSFCHFHVRKWQNTGWPILTNNIGSPISSSLSTRVTIPLSIRGNWFILINIAFQFNVVEISLIEIFWKICELPCSYLLISI